MFKARGVRHDVSTRTGRVRFICTSPTVVQITQKWFQLYMQHTACSSQSPIEQINMFERLFNLQKCSLWYPQDLHHWQPHADAWPHPPFCPPKIGHMIKSTNRTRMQLHAKSHTHTHTHTHIIQALTTPHTELFYYLPHTFTEVAVASPCSNHSYSKLIGSVNIIPHVGSTRTPPGLSHLFCLL